MTYFVSSERLLNDLFCVQWDVKPQLSQSVSQCGMTMASTRCLSHMG